MLDSFVGDIKRKKVIYIAGPYRDARGEWFVRQNIRAAEAAALLVWEMGGVAICPHKNTAGFGGACDDAVWLEGDMELLHRCDAIFVVEGWERSSGARAEVEQAREWGLKVLVRAEEVDGFING